MFCTRVAARRDLGLACFQDHLLFAVGGRDTPQYSQSGGHIPNAPTNVVEVFDTTTWNPGDLFLFLPALFFIYSSFAKAHNNVARSTARVGLVKGMERWTVCWLRRAFKGSREYVSSSTSVSLTWPLL